MALRGGLTPSLPKLPSLTGRKKRPRPAYSIDLETERRKYPRVPIDELSRRGAAVLRERLPSLPKQDRRSAFTKVLDVLDVPRNVVANILARLGGVKVKGKRKGALLKKVWASDLLAGLGLKKGAVRSVVGFVGDVALDPLTYATTAAMTGLRIAKHLPKILRPAEKMLRQAAKGGRIAPELAKALGITRTTEVIRGLAKRRGLKAAQKALMGRRGGALSRLLAKRATRGDKAALEFIAKHGEKGRGLFRFPFTAKAFPILPFGAKARKMRAVQESLEAGAQKTFGKIAQAKAAPAKALKIREAGFAAREVTKATELRRGQQAAAELTKRFEVAPKAQAMLEAKMAVTAARRGAKKAAKGLKKQLGKAGRIEEAGQRQLTRIVTSPTEAPGVIRELTRAKIGPYQAPGAPGVLAALQRGKRQAFGPPTTPLSQKIVGTQQRIARAGVVGERAKRDMVKQLEPAIARLAKETGRSADDVRNTIGTLIDAGTKGSELGVYRGIDPLLDIAKREQAILRNPDVARIFTQHFGAQRAMRGIEKARGLDIGKIEPFAKRLPTKEAAAQMKMQQIRVPKAAERGRAYWRVFETPEGETKHILSSGIEAGKEATALKAAGAKETGKRLISKAQWDQWAQLPPAKRPAHIGPEYAGAPAFKGPQFQADLAASAGARAAQHERRMAVAAAREWMEPLGAKVPAGRLAKGPQYAHMAVPKAPAAGSPFAEMPELFQRAYPQQVTDAINDMTRVWDDPKAIESLMKASDTYLGFWKSMQLYHPAYIIRNVFQNFFGGLMAGANPVDVANKVTSREVRALRGALLAGDPTAVRGMMMQVGGRKVPLQQLFDFGQTYPLVGVGRTAQEIPAQLAGRTMMREAGAIGGRVGRGAHGAVFKLNTWVEDTQRLATWIHFMDKGMDAQSAFMQTLRAMPNLADLTHWERHYARRLFPFYCVPDDHRILTRFGWKEVDELKLGEDVLTYNVEKDLSEWQPIQAINVFDYDGELMTLKNTLSKFSFTPNHRWAVCSRTTKDGREVGDIRKVVKGYQLRDSHRIPKSVPHSFNGADGRITERDAALIGWVVTDGYRRTRQTNGYFRHEAVIYQKKPQHLDTIRDLLGSDARSESVHPDTGTICFRMSTTLTKHLRAVCPDKAHLPEFVSRLTKAAAEAMWQAMIDAEASVHPRAGIQFAQKGGPVLVAFQMLCLMLGRTADCRSRADKEGKSGAYVSKGRRWMKVAGCLGAEWYNGRVWCPTTANGTWFMEHDGRVVVTGNSWMRKNGALQLFHYLPQKPAYAAMLPRFKNFVEGFRGKDNVPDELRPMWMQEQAGIQIAGGREAGMVGLAQTWFPFEEVLQAGAVAVGEPEEAARRLAGSIRPELKAGIEAASGQDIFKRQARVPWREAIAQRGLVRTGYEALGGRSQTILDPLMALRPVREWGPHGRVAGMPTPAGKVSRAVLGGALQPVDYQRGLLARFHELNNLQRRIRALYNRALQAGDQALADKLLHQWIAIMRQSWEYKFPMARRMEETFQAAGVPQRGPP